MESSCIPVQAAKERYGFLAGGGELADRIAAFDWAATPIGPLSDWPPTLRTATGMVLRSAIPMLILWGEAGIIIYNSAYVSIAGDRHPDLLGSPIRDARPDLADFTDRVMRTCLAGETLSFKDHEFTQKRNGQTVEISMNLDYSPILDDDGVPAGVLVVAAETTKRVAARRRARDERRRLEQMFQQAPGVMALLSGPDHVFTLTNEAYDRFTGHRDLLGKSVREAMPDLAGQGFYELLDEVYASGQPYVGNAAKVVMQQHPDSPLEDRYVDFVYQPITESDGTVTGIFVEGIDVTDRVRMETIHAAQRRALELTVADAPLGEVLAMLVETAEAQSSSGMIGSILLLDTDGQHLRHGAGPSLPTAYTEAIDGVAIGPNVGSCGTAAFTKAPVMVSDIASDPLWEDFRDLALAHGLRACWSIPILARKGQVLGTFALYYPQPGEPSPADRQMVDLITRTASLVIERSHIVSQRKMLIDELNHRVKNTLAVVQAISSQTFRDNGSDPVLARSTFDARLRALSGTHDLLTQESWEHVGLGDLAHQVMQPFAASAKEQNRFTASGPDIKLSPNIALSLSMAFHELASNASKYGALAVDADGQVELSWNIDAAAGTLRIRWQESGGPKVSPPSRQGFGTRLIERGLARELGGAVKLDFDPAGLVCTIEMPLSRAR
ncbi:PAS domain-containing sensor histidine kinase [Maricaulis sp. CAU 1757]